MSPSHPRRGPHFRAYFPRFLPAAAWSFPGPGFWPVSERLTYYVLFSGPARLRAVGPRVSTTPAPPALAAVLFSRDLPGGRSPGGFPAADRHGRPGLHLGLPGRDPAQHLRGPFPGPRPCSVRDWMTLSGRGPAGPLVPLGQRASACWCSRATAATAAAWAAPCWSWQRNPLILSCNRGVRAQTGFDLVLPRGGHRLDGDHGARPGPAHGPCSPWGAGAALRGAAARATGSRWGVASLAHLVALPLAAFFPVPCSSAWTRCRATRPLIYTAIPVVRVRVSSWPGRWAATTGSWAVDHHHADRALRGHAPGGARHTRAVRAGRGFGPCCFCREKPLVF